MFKNNKLEPSGRLNTSNASLHRRNLLSTAVFAAMLGSPAAFALDFNLGDVRGTANAQVSAGASWRVEDRSDKLVSQGNGGTATSNTTDDGNLNFDKGDTFSKIIKGTADLQLEYENFGAFASAKFWHDFELANEGKPHGHIANNYVPGADLNDDNFDNLAQFSGVELLDAFVYGSFDVAERPLDLRLGNQVVSWGESTFIQGGVNSINPIDVSAFRRPGAEIKEGLLPVGMIYGNLGVTDNLSLEAFYQLKWEKTVLDGCGTYFSQADFAADGCDGLPFVASLPDRTNLAVPGAVIARSSDLEPGDSGQFGIAPRYYSEALDTEFGFYYLNYNSRLPYIGGTRSTTGPDMVGVNDDFDGTYNIVFPEDIQVFGLSAATTLGTWSVSGEVSYRPDMPIQINGNDLLQAVVSDGKAGLAADVAADVAPGEQMTGYDEYDVFQAQVTGIKFFDQVLGASRLTLIGEAGMTYINDFDGAGKGGHRYGRSPAFGVGAEGETDGYVSRFAWGYRARANLRYTDVFAGINLTPSLAWSQDVKGWSPAPAPQFNEGSKALSIGLNADYLEKYNASLSYTSFFGGDFNDLEDRDFVAFTVGAAF